MQQEGDTVFQKLNYREIAASRRHWNQTQRKRAAAMDHAIQFSRIKKVPIRVIVVDGSRRNDADDESRSVVERRFLDPEPWHVAAYDADGNCRLQRGHFAPAPETFTPDEITGAGTYSEGALGETTTKTSERSKRLRNPARDHFSKQSLDGRLHCAVCNWTPPTALQLTGPIVEIHHGLGISQYPADGRALTLEEAVQHLPPLCPNCHRIVHAKPGGGAFSETELRAAAPRHASNPT
jgi:predicted HNH restriction endonuclease